MWSAGIPFIVLLQNKAVITMASCFNDVGQICSQLGIDSSSLLSYLSSQSIKQLPEVDSETISNGLILELLRFKDQHSQCTFKILYSWVRDLYGKSWPYESPPTSKAITKSIRRLMEVSQKFKKEKSYKSRKVAEFLQQEYTLPKLGIHKGKVVHFSPAKKSQEGIDINDHDQLAKKIAYSQKKVTEVRQKMYAANRNANKKLKRREVVIAQQKASITSQQQVIKMHESKLKGANH